MIDKGCTGRMEEWNTNRLYDMTKDLRMSVQKKKKNTETTVVLKYALIGCQRLDSWQSWTVNSLSFSKLPMTTISIVECVICLRRDEKFGFLHQSEMRQTLIMHMVPLCLPKNRLMSHICQRFYAKTHFWGMKVFYLYCLDLQCLWI